MTHKALICDDKADRVQTWAATVANQLTGMPWEVSSRTGTQLAALIIALSNADQGRVTADDQAVLDEVGAADLVILDSDLSADPQDLVGLSDEDALALRNQYGDEVARQIRTHTTAGFIVVVNMFTGRDSHRVFDLTMQQDASTYADLHIGEDDLGDAHLWSGSIEGGYAPWSRPVLTTAHEWVRRSESAIVDLDDRVMERLALDPGQLATRQLDVFGAVRPEDATYRSLAQSKMGLKYPDGHSDASMQRMAASVVRRWLTRTVLAAQDEIIDTPHLIARVPHLLGGSGGDDGGGWNAHLVKDWDTGVLPGTEGALLTQLEPHIDRATYSLTVARSIPPRESFEGSVLVFLEDRSRFVERPLAVQIETDVPGKNFRRYVLPDEDGSIQYEPFTRLLQ